MKKVVLILATIEDTQSLYMQKKLYKLGYSSVIVDSRIFPENVNLTYDINPLMNGYISFNDAKDKIDLSDIVGIYYRVVKGILKPNEEDTLLKNVVHLNNEAYFNSFLQMLNHCNWVNSPESIINHQKKPYQLQLLKQEGILIPETYITNDIEFVNKKFNQGDKQFIFKPVRGWANTELLTKEMLEQEDSSGLLKRTPITLQEYIKGENLRIYVIGENVFPVKINTKDIDSRESSDNVHEKTELPEEIVDACIKVTKTLNFAYSAIDMIKTANDQYYLLEANATPIFLNDELSLGYPISDKICELLVKTHK